MVLLDSYVLRTATRKRTEGKAAPVDGGNPQGDRITLAANSDGHVHTAARPTSNERYYYSGKGNLAVCRFETYWHAIRSDNELEEGELAAGGSGDIPAPYLILFYWSIITRHGSQ